MDCVLSPNFFSIVPMSNTLNKDGTPRKVGSGKTKGAGCYEHITWTQLKSVIGKDTKIPVSRVWVNNLGFITKPKSQKTDIKKNSEKKVNSPKDLPTPKVTHINKKLEKTTGSTEKSTSSEYEPPPLFAGEETNLNQY